MLQAMQSAYGLGPMEIPAALILCMAALWLAWRVWRFTLAPALWPLNPRQLPYLVPWLGHTISFMTSADKLYEYANKYYGSDDSMYSLTVAGGTIVILRNTGDLAAVWRNTVSLSYDPFVSRMLLAFGIPAGNVDKVMTRNASQFVCNDHDRKTSLLVKENPKRKSYIHLQSDWFKQQLLPGQRLEQLTADNMRQQNLYLQFDMFKDDCIRRGPGLENNGAVKTVLLGRLCRSALSTSAVQTFFGQSLLDVEPDFLTLYQKWEDDSWKVFYNIPPLLAPDLHKARERAVQALVRYYELPLDERRGMAWIFGVLDNELRCIGYSAENRAGVIMMIVWAINNNAHYICFWMLAHMLCKPHVLAALRRQVEPAFEADGTMDLDHLMKQCPHLDAAWHEALRVYNASTAVRKAVDPLVVGGKQIHAGDQIFGPARNFQLDANEFGQHARSFRLERFLEQKNLAKSRYYVPFGGGHTYCPGRHFAQRETYMMIAKMVHWYDFQILDSTGAVLEDPVVPRVERNIPAPAAMRPEHDLLVRVERRKI